MTRKYKVVCDRCGFNYKAEELRKTWEGLYCCTRCWEPRHGSDLFRPPKDPSPLPWTRPDDNEGTYTVLTGNQTLTVGNNRIAEWATDLTSNVTIVLSTTGARAGDKINIYRTGEGNYTMDINGLKTTQAALPFHCTVNYTGTAWEIEQFMYLGI